MTKLAIQLLVLHFTPQIIFFQASIQAHKVFPSKKLLELQLFVSEMR